MLAFVTVAVTTNHFVIIKKNTQTNANVKGKIMKKYNIYIYKYIIYNKERDLVEQ